MEFTILEPGDGLRYEIGYHVTKISEAPGAGVRQVVLCWFKHGGAGGSVLRVSHLPDWKYIVEKMNCGLMDAKTILQALRSIFATGKVGKPDWVAKDLENPQVIMTLAAAGGAK